VKRLALITVILGSALALVPFASAMVRSEGAGGIDFSATAPSFDPATQAVLLRSQGLADHYSANAVTLHTDTLGGKAAPDSLPVSSGNSFDWSNALAVTLGAMLILAIAATTITRRRQRLSY
jgi:hypothetical protein